MQHNNWMAKLTLEIMQQLPQKYATSEFIEKELQPKILLEKIYDVIEILG